MEALRPVPGAAGLTAPGLPGTPWSARLRTLLREFRTFAFSGSLLDVAIGIAIGAAFATVVQSLVDNVILRLVAAIFGEPSFRDVEPLVA